MIFVLGDSALMQTESNRSPAAPKMPAALASVALLAVSSAAYAFSLRSPADTLAKVDVAHLQKAGEIVTAVALDLARGEGP